MSDFLTIKPAIEDFEDTSDMRFLLDEVNNHNDSFKKNINRLQKILVQKTRPFFMYDCEEGILDSANLPQVVVNPTKKDYYKQKRDGIIPTTCVSFVIDSSLLKTEELKKAMASIFDITINRLEQASINSELYSFDNINIIKYKNSFETWNKSKNSISKLLAVDSEKCSKLTSALKTIILRQKKYYENNKVLFHLSENETDKKIYLFAKRNNVTYICLDIGNIINPEDIKSLFISKLSSSFGLKFKKY